MTWCGHVARGAVAVLLSPRLRPTLPICSALPSLFPVGHSICLVPSRAGNPILLYIRVSYETVSRFYRDIDIGSGREGGLSQGMPRINRLVLLDTRVFPITDSSCPYLRSRTDPPSKFLLPLSLSLSQFHRNTRRFVESRKRRREKSERAKNVGA